MQGEHLIMIANFRHELYFTVSLGCKGYNLLNNQHYKQMMPVVEVRADQVGGVGDPMY